MEIKNLFYLPLRPFSKKRELNWLRIKIVCISAPCIVVAIILFMPTKKAVNTSFHEKSNSVDNRIVDETNDPTQETAKQLQNAQSNSAIVHTSLDFLYQDPMAKRGGNVGGTANANNRNSSMIIPRTGNNSKTQLSPGTKFLVRLTEKIIVANQGMPVIGFIPKDVAPDGDLAIPQGSKLIGDITFDDSSERAQVNWRSIIFPDGRERPLSGLGVGRDGQLGVEGNVKSTSVKNAVGKTLTRFIGAYAEGSMNRGQFGANPGGSDNGMKNAIAETARDQANSYAEYMSAEKKWIELEMGAEFYTILNQPFLFRDPGSTYGK
ncbi:MAG: TrbI/VirB10 family protein [Bacteriovoracaceae bacterium]|nr:TrbI/VirB10 family protein [Bacteriovoracaceae bacterium]